jgi:AT-rich DNA-binding protein
MKLEPKPIPMQTLKRLPPYYNLLLALQREGTENVSAPAIAKRLGLHEVQVKKDLALVSMVGGKPRTGFQVRELVESIGRSLGYYNTMDAVLVGAGQLGCALLSYDGFDRYGVKIIAAFDTSKSIVGTTQGGKPVMDIGSLRLFCRRLSVRMGIIAVPAEHAQEVCNQLVNSGVLAIWNFAPVHLDVPPDVFVHNENMAVSLSLLSQHLIQKDWEELL